MVGLCFLSGCFELNAQASSERARTELQLGVDAYKETKYSEAIQHFQLALTADPDFHTARLYLATTLAQECVPGVKTAENDMYCNGSISQFRQVLEHDPMDLAALKAIASLYFNLQRLDEAKEYQRKVMELDPRDPEAPYFIAVLDWSQSYKRRMNAKDQAGLEPQDPFITATECSKLRTENLPIIEEAMKMLSTALTLRPDYDDAMAYMNLVYRERADIQCGNRAAFDADIRSGDDWVKMTIDVKQQKAREQSGAAR